LNLKRVVDSTSIGGGEDCVPGGVGFALVRVVCEIHAFEDFFDSFIFVDEVFSKEIVNVDE